MFEPKDKRSAPRLPVHLVAELELNGQQIGCGVSRDVSGSGLLLMTHLNLEPGTEIGLRLYVPREAEARRLKARVIRSEPILQREGIVWDRRIALALDDPPPDLEQILRNLSKHPTNPPAQV
jgi:hypothetical protein